MCCTGNLNTIKDIAQREAELGVIDKSNTLAACPLTRNGKKPSIFLTQVLPVICVFVLVLGLHYIGLF